MSININTHVFKKFIEDLLGIADITHCDADDAYCAFNQDGESIVDISDVLLEISKRFDVLEIFLRRILDADDKEIPNLLDLENFVENEFNPDSV